MTLADATVDQLGTCRLGKKHKRLRSKNRGLPKKQWDFTMKRFWDNQRILLTRNTSLALPKKKEQAAMENFSQGTIWFQHHRIEFHQQTRSVSLANIVAGLDDDELTISP